MIETATQGTVYTFYSFKGGVGRTMALANVAALLAKWGHSVLVVDWDLEAPGIERFFFKDKAVAKERRTEKPGIVDLVIAKGNRQPIDWQTCVHELTLNGSPRPLSLITAGKGNGEYIGNLQKLSFPELFEKSDLGAYIESLRDEWISKFDFVLVDSRTGVTDIGGICTVLLADILVLLFTTTDSSTDGVLDIMMRAREARQHIPRDRQRLIAIPVPARDESRTEYQSAKVWREKVAERFGDLYTDWLPTGVTAHDALEILKIPYVPYWSFGERLPVIEEGTGDPASLGYAYEVLAKIVASKLDWEVVKGQSTVSSTKIDERQVNKSWHATCGRDVQQYFNKTGLRAYMEIYHYCKNIHSTFDAAELLIAAEKSDTKVGISTGRVETNPESGPLPLSDGIIAISESSPFYYWRINNYGDFFTWIPLYDEDDPEIRSLLGIEQPPLEKLYVNSRIAAAADALIHCARLYRNLQVPPHATINFTIEYSGVNGRKLGFLNDPVGDLSIRSLRPSKEWRQEVHVAFNLGTFDQSLVNHVKELCRPLFLLFDYKKFPDSVYETVIKNFFQQLK